MTCVVLALCARSPSPSVVALRAAASKQGEPPARILDIGVGGAHSCAVVARGPQTEVRCWGLNERGQLGGPTSTSVTVPVVVANLDDAVEVAGGVEFTCARRRGGAVACWGEVPPRSSTPSIQPSPVNVAGVRDAAQLAIGDEHACVRTVGGSVACWGANYHGQLGDGSTASRLDARPVPGLSGVLDLAADAHTSCAVLRSGGVRCWGDNVNGELGSLRTLFRGRWSRASAPPIGVSQARPVAVTGVRDAVSVRVVGAMACAVRRSGAVACWGERTMRPRPVEGVRDVRAMLGSILLDREGRLFEGELDGEPHEEERRGRMRMTGLRLLARDVDQLALGARHGCVRRGARGEVWCWGENQWGQVGDGTTTEHPGPVVVGGQMSVRVIAVGQEHSCAVDDGGEVWCWGFNGSGQLGTSTAADSSSVPVRAAGVRGAVAITVAGGTSCALIGGGAVWCWGWNGNGEAGNGTSGVGTNASPGPVVGVSDAIAIAGHRWHTCAVRRGGSVACWGEGSVVGSGVTSSPRALAVAGVTDAVEIAVGDQHACARLRSGRVSCWADFAPTPTLLAGVHDARRVAATASRTCVLLADGTVRCGWARGDLEPVAGITDAVDISMFGSEVCAVRRAGAVVCWADRRAPAPVAQLSDVAQVSVGDRRACALRTDATLACWGDDDHGQLGAGSVPVYRALVRVAGL